MNLFRFGLLSKHPWSEQLKTSNAQEHAILSMLSILRYNLYLFKWTEFSVHLNGFANIRFQFWLF